MSEITITAPTKWLAKAAALCKIASLQGQDVSILDHVLFRVNHDHIRLTATNEATLCDIKVPLTHGLPDLEEDPISFLVRPAALVDLIANESLDDFTFTINFNKYSFIVISSNSSLALPIRDSSTWSDIDTRFDRDAEMHVPIHKHLLKDVIRYNKFYMGSPQDSAMHFVEVRNEMAISTNRSRFGFLVVKELSGLEFNLPGEQLGILDKALDIFPELLHIESSQGYTIFASKDPNIEICFGLIKGSLSLPATLDQVPELLEPNNLILDRATLGKALTKLAIVCNKTDPRVKISINASNCTLSTSNEIGHESKVVLEATETTSRATVIVPLLILQKALKLSSDPSISLRFGPDNRYLKIVDVNQESIYFGVFTSMPSLT